MSTATAEPPPTHATAAPRELRIYMHSWLLYWWPVWVAGYLMAMWTLLEDRHMALVPPGTVAEANVLIAPEGKVPLLTPVHMAASRVPGMVFTLTLFAVLAFGTGWLSGWRALTFAAMTAAVLLFVSWMDWWGTLVHWAAYLTVHINLGGYLVLSTGLFILWIFQILVVDRRTYLTFTLSQLRVHYSIGEEVKVYDTGGLAFEKAPYDWFRWLVGFGAGDLHVRTRGETIEVPNVVGLGRRLNAIEELIRTKDVV